MIINNNLFYPGNVKFNTFNIDFDKPFTSQLDELNEDLIQVEYEGGIILDIGWYPEGDEKGLIVIQIIHNNEWDNPLNREEIKEKESFFKGINKSLHMIDSMYVGSGELIVDMIDFFFDEYNDDDWTDFANSFSSVDVIIEGVPQDVINAVYSIIGENGDEWLKSPLRKFDGKTALDLLLSEKGEKALKAFIMRMPN